jgi:hypothetical protein
MKVQDIIEMLTLIIFLMGAYKVIDTGISNDNLNNLILLNTSASDLINISIPRYTLSDLINISKPRYNEIFNKNNMVGLMKTIKRAAQNGDKSLNIHKSYQDFGTFIPNSKERKYLKKMGYKIEKISPEKGTFYQEWLISWN